MTRIKKRRSGKKRTSDRKKVSTGRRGGRAVKKAVDASEKKFAAPDKADTESPGSSGHNKSGEPIKATGKTRSTGSRRIAAARSIAAVTKGKTVSNKTSAATDEISGEKKPAKGFAPWNKNKFKKKPRPSASGETPAKKYATSNTKKSVGTAKKTKPAGKGKAVGKRYKKD